MKLMTIIKEVNWVRRIVSLILIFTGMILFAGQAQLNWFELANNFTKYAYLGICFLINALGCAIFVKGNPKMSLSVVVISLIAQIGTILAGGFRLSADDPNQAPLYILDAVTSVTATTQIIDTVVNAIVVIIPCALLVCIVVGIVYSDDFDDIEQKIIEGGIALIIVAIFYALGGLIGFMPFSF